MPIHIKKRFTFKIQWYGAKDSTFTTTQLARELAWKKLWTHYAILADQIHIVELASEEVFEPEPQCCSKQKRNMDGWCINCGDPCL